MNSDAKLKCRLLLAMFPVTLGEAVAAEPRICELAGLTQRTTGSGLAIDLARLREVVSVLDLGQTAQVTTEAGSFPLRRTSDGVLVGPLGAPEPTQRLLEAGLFDPDLLVRQRSFEDIAHAIWPTMQAEGRWRQLVEERPLSAGEVVALIGTREYSPRRFVSAFAAKHEFAIEDLVPESIGYFEGLIGASPLGREYGVNDLLAHLDVAVRRDAYWGWRLVRAAFIGNFFSPSQVCAPIDGNLLQEFLARERHLTPASILAALEVRLHQPDGLAASPSASDLFAMLALPQVAAAGALGVAIFRLAFARLAFLDSRCSASWRRVVAFVHANLMAEVLADAPDLAQAVHEHCSSLGAFNTAAEAWDLRSGPLWQAGLAILAEPGVVAAARGRHLLVQAAATDLPVPQDLLPEDPRAIDEMWIGLRVGAPPLQGEHDPYAAEPQVLGLDDLGIAQFPSRWSAENWNFLLLCADVRPLDRDVIAAVEAQLSSGIDSRSLPIAARIAAEQVSESLAIAVRAACAAAIVDAKETIDVALIFHAATLLAACHRERWGDFLDAIFREFAITVQRGKPAQALVLMMETLLQLVPLEQRQWKAALAMARCAA